MDNLQPSFTEVEYGNRRRVSRREQFLVMMDATIPWTSWVGLIEPHHYRDAKGKRGRKAKPVATMLRMYLLQVWFSLSDEGVEDAVYDSYAMRRFLGFGLDPVRWTPRKRGWSSWEDNVGGSPPSTRTRP